MGMRYYDPAVGRFISQDPIGLKGETPDLYQYPEDNPISINDPTGLSPNILDLLNHFADVVGTGADFFSQVRESNIEAGGVNLPAQSGSPPGEGVSGSSGGGAVPTSDVPSNDVPSDPAATVSQLSDLTHFGIDLVETVRQCNGGGEDCAGQVGTDIIDIGAYGAAKLLTTLQPA